MLSILRPLIAGVGLVGSSYLLPLSPPSFFPQSWRASPFPPPPPQHLPQISTFGRSRSPPRSKCCVSPDPSQSSCTAAVSPSWWCNVPENEEQLLWKHSSAAEAHNPNGFNGLTWGWHENRFKSRALYLQKKLHLYCYTMQSAWHCSHQWSEIHSDFMISESNFVMQEKL